MRDHGRFEIIFKVLCYVFFFLIKHVKNLEKNVETKASGFSYSNIFIDMITVIKVFQISLIGL